MKIKDFCDRMNNHGTNPCIQVFERGAVIYEGSPYNVPNEIAKMRVESFTVDGIGFVMIHAI